MSLTYNEAVEQTITAGEQIHQIVNGTATTEVTVEDGSKVPSIRKALLDNFYFKDPIAWQVGQTENVFNQLRQFTDGSWWYAPSATASNPVSMGSTPVGNPLWKSYSFDAIGKLTPQIREALRRSYAEAGYNLVNGSFEAGGTVTMATDALLYEADGKAYSWGGTMPKTVPANSTPATTGGVSTSGWLPLGDITLRTDLSSSASGKGVDLVAGALKQASLVLQAVTKIPSYNPANVLQAWKDSVAAYGYVYFPGNNAASNYTVVGEDAAIFGSVVIVDDGVNLMFDDDRYPLIGSLKFRGQCQVTITPKNFSATGGEVDYIRKTANLDRFPLKAKPIPFDECSFQTVISDTFTTGTLGSSSGSAVVFDLSPGNTSGLFVPIDIGETITGHLRMERGTATSLAIMLRCANGWVKFSGAPGVAGGLTYTYKLLGQGVQEGPNSPIPMPSNTLASYAIGKASIGVALVGRNTVRVIVNGVAGYYPITTPAGDIYEVGFVAEGASNPSAGRVTGLCSYRTDDNRTYGAAPTYLGIWGDSTAEKWLSTFDRYLPQVMDGALGSRSLVIENNAVAGETFAQQYARLVASGPGNNSIICMVAGTNEGQGGVTADAFAVQVQQFCDYCAGQGRKAMLVEPWMWYDESFIGGAGQNSSNYDNVSELREAGKRVALNNGAIYVSTTHELPAPLPQYFNSGLDPLLRDDIHQSELGYRLYAELIGSHIVDYLSSVDVAGRAIPSYWQNSAVVTAIESSVATSTSIYAEVTVSSFSNGAVVLNLPRWCKPDRPLTFNGLFSDTGGVFKGCKVRYNSGQVTVDGLTTTASTIIVNMNW